MRADLVEVEPRLEIEIVGAGAVLEVEIDEAGRVRILRAALRRSIAASIASVVVPPPAGDRNEMIWLPSSGRLEVAFKDLMQP